MVLVAGHYLLVYSTDQNTAFFFYFGLFVALLPCVVASTLLSSCFLVFRVVDSAEVALAKLDLFTRALLGSLALHFAVVFGVGSCRCTRRRSLPPARVVPSVLSGV